MGKRKPAMKSVTKATAPVEKTGQRGGVRVNAGRKPGSVTKRLQGIREVTMDIIKQGKLPLRVMINNMIYYDEKAGFLEERFADALADNAKSFKPEQMLKAMELLAEIGDARMKAQKCACDAAPFLHARLSQISMDVNHTTPRDLKNDASIDEYREHFNQLRNQVLTLDNETGEPVDQD